MTTTTQLDTGQLWRWVDRLTLDRRQRLVRQHPGGKPHVDHVDVPSLWTQLTEAVASSNAGGGRGKASTGSRSPLDLAIEALLIEVSDLVTDAIRSHGSRPRIHLEDALTIRHRHDVRSDLRQLATVLVGTGDADLVDWWTDRYRTWVSRAETALTGEDENVDLRGVRGHACPDCRTLWVTTTQPSTAFPAGVETFREPALVVAFRDGQVLHITCRACRTGWWRGDDVDSLRRQIALQTAIHGPAQLWGQTVPRTMTS